MKRTILKVQQGGGAWMRARCGIPTASRFEAIVTPKGKPTDNAARRAYVAELVCEQLTGETVQHFTTAAMQRGTDCEPAARAWYELRQGVTVDAVGMVMLAGDKPGEAWACGASPDGLVGEAGGIEIKVPLPVNLVAACINDDTPADYMAQVQGNLWVTGRAWWDLILYGPEPGLPSRVWRIEPDARYHAALDECIPAFCKEVAAAVARVRRTCYVSTREARREVEEAMDPTANW